MTTRPSIPIPETVLGLVRQLEDAGFETWCVGGAVRDHLLGDPNSDFDLATSATPDQVRALFRHTVDVGATFGTIGVLDRDRTLHEVTTFRRDVSTDGRRAVVAFGGTLEEDLARRDFTINAIAFHPVRLEWRDPFNGFGDLQAKTIRAVGIPGERFREDYLRILRGVRFASRLGFEIEAATWTAILAESPGLKGLSAERVREEWFKSLRTTRSLPRLVALWGAALGGSPWMPELLAELPRVPVPPEVFPRDPVLLTAFLTRDPAAVLRRLKASGAELDRVTAIARGPGAPAGADERSVRRWLSSVTPAVAEDLAALVRLRTGGAPAWAAPMAAIIARGDPISRGDLAVGGDDLLQAGVPAGRSLGAALSTLLDYVLDDPVRNTRESLLQRARELR